MASPRLAGAAAPVSRLSVAPVLQPERSQAVRSEVEAGAAPRQESLFPPSSGPSRERLRVVELPGGPGRREATRKEAGGRVTLPGGTRTVTARDQGQQRLAFPVAQPDHTPADSSIYCDAPVALPAHRIMAAMLDGSMMLISLGIFLIIFHLAGAKVILNKTTLPLYGCMAFATLVLYRLLWCLAGTDSVGMRWSGLRLISFDGVVPHRGQRMQRLLGSFISLAAGGLGLVWGLVDEEHLTWHDHMSKTFPTPRARQLRYPKR
ncbi:MAG: RDD family protein [Bryobacterales bacterium]|nr:RDD family protein [Bryobacterales bacterium]